MKRKTMMEWIYKNAKYIPLMVVAFFVPLAVYYSYYEAPQSVIKIMHMTSNAKIDMYTLGKSYLLNFSGFLMIGYFIYNFNNKSRESLKSFEIEYKALGIMFVFIILSTIFSEYREVALYGFIDRYEGFFIWTIYFIIVVYIRLFMKDVHDFEKILDVIKASSIVAGIIGIVEYMGYNIIIQDWFKNIFVENKLRGAEYEIVYSYDKTIKTTLYNSNFAGSFFAMTTVLFLSGLLFNKSKKIFNLIGFVISLLALIGTNSAAGFVGFAIAIVFMIILNIGMIFRNKRTVMALVMLIITASVFVWNISGYGNMVKSEIGNLINVKNRNESLKQFDKLLLSDNLLTVGFDDISFKLKASDSRFKFYDQFDNVLDYTFNEDEKYFGFNDIKYSGIKIAFTQNENVFKYTQKNLVFYIAIENNIMILADRSGNVYRELDEVRSIGFNGYESIGTSRGYIWSRSLPVMLNHVFIGSGADTFVFYFPQDDLIGKFNFHFDERVVIDKPHNMFIQIGVNFGMIFLLLYLLLVFKYLIEAVKLYKISQDENIKNVLISAILAVLSFNVAGLFNDSTIGTSSIYWLLLGIGIAANKYTLKSDKATT